MDFMRLCMQAYKSPTHFVLVTIGFTEKLSVDPQRSHSRHHYSNSLTVSSYNQNWFDISVGIYGAEQLPVAMAASYSMQVFEKSCALLIQCY